MATSNPYVIHALPGLTEFSGDGVLVASPRGRILDAMTATVAERGYAATSIAEVIKRAHASRSTFYEQFADKEDCYLAAYQLASDHVATQIAHGRAVQPAQPGRPPVSDLRDLPRRAGALSRSRPARSSSRYAPQARPASNTAAP